MSSGRFLSGRFSDIVGKKEPCVKTLYICGDKGPPLRRDWERHFKIVALPEENYLSAAQEDSKESNVVNVFFLAQDDWRPDIVAAVRKCSLKMFIIEWRPDATENPGLRLMSCESGANMVTGSVADLNSALSKVASTNMQGSHTCNWCGMSNLSELEYGLHHPLYHIYDFDLRGNCQACGVRYDHLARHLNEKHTLADAQEERTGVFALVIVRRPTDGKFLMCQERHQQGYWVPGGGILKGETIRRGAVRETMEETGVAVELKGVLTCERRTQKQWGTWRRLIFYAEPAVDCTAPKTVPDYESAGACWVDLEELNTIKLRSTQEPTVWFNHVASGKTIPPLVLPDGFKGDFSEFQF